MDNIGIGLELMVVGMITVFVILLIVIYGSTLLIHIVNKLAPEEPPVPKKANAPASATGQPDAQTMAVLAEAVKQITGGKGHIVKTTVVS